MRAVKYDLVLDQGSDFNLKLTFKTNEAIRNLTGYNVRAHARKTISGEVAFTFTPSIVDATQGTFLLTVLAAESDLITPGRYYYDVELYGNGQVDRVLGGVITVTPGVTR